VAGFEEEFEKIYISYFNDVFLKSYQNSSDESIAEEITSETFFNAMRSMDPFRGKTDVRVFGELSFKQIGDIVNTLEKHQARRHQTRERGRVWSGGIV